MPSKPVWKQCPGCWSAALWPADVDHECDCGELLTTIDLRAATPSQPVSGDVVVAAKVKMIAAGLRGAESTPDRTTAIEYAKAAREDLLNLAAALASSPSQPSKGVTLEGEVILAERISPDPKSTTQFAPYWEIAITAAATTDSIPTGPVTVSIATDSKEQQA